MSAALAELWRRRELLWAWTARELRVRYQQSLLGGLWALLQPLALMLLFTLVFSVFTRLPSDGLPHPVFFLAGLLPWTFFAASLSNGAASLVSNLGLVTRIYFPREILPLAAVLAAGVDLAVTLPVLLGLLLAYRLPPGPGLAWALPAVLGVALLGSGAALLAALLNAYYRDVRFVLPLLIQAWLYASPVIYPLSAVPARFRVIYLLNPMAGLVESFRKAVTLGLAPDPLVLGSGLCLALVFFLISYAVFKRYEGALADVI